MTGQSVAIVTGSLGLVGAAAVRRLCAMGFDVHGIDNDQRRAFFGPLASNAGTRQMLEAGCPTYRHHDLDIRDANAVTGLFERLGVELGAVVHAAAQPSHDWAASDPATDFQINAVATQHLLEATRHHAPEASFLFVSTNKVYGDHPNTLPLQTLDTRLDLDPDHRFFARGIDERMSIDQTRHSLFGVSKTAADLMVQEYARRFDLHTVVFRAGCLTGPDHHGAKAHGFLSYLCRVAQAGDTYQIIGHGGKQVRDNLHADDLADAFACVITGPRRSGVYNIGGGRDASCSVIEALDIAGDVLGQPVAHTFAPDARYGDHMWWISDTTAFRQAYPDWAPRHTVPDLISSMLA